MPRKPKTPPTKPPHPLTGRPSNAAKPPGTTLSAACRFRCHPDDLRAYQRAARKAGLTRDAWIRHTLHQATQTLPAK